jgi:hypothetical protein
MALGSCAQSSDLEIYSQPAHPAGDLKQSRMQMLTNGRRFAACMPMQVPRLVPGRLLQLELQRVAANTSRLMGRRVPPQPVDTAQLCGGEAHVAALLSWVQVSTGCQSCMAEGQRLPVVIDLYDACCRTSRF